MTKKQRVQYIDMVRGVAICLVILGHIWDNPLCRFISSFHVPVFFVLSGHLMYVKDSEKEGQIQLKDYILKRVKSLMAPYLLYSIIWIIVMCVFESSSISLKENIISTLVLYGCGALWFLPALFISEILFVLIQKLFGKDGSQGSFFLVSMLLFLIGLGCLSCLSLPYKVLFMVMRSCVGFGFLAIGYFVSPYLHRWKCYKVSMMVALIVDVIAAYFNGVVDLWGGQFNNIFLYLLTSIMGSVLCIHLISKIEKKWIHIVNVKKILVYLGCNTIPIIGTHQLFIKLFRDIFRYDFYGYVSGLALFILVLSVEIAIIFIINFVTDRKIKTNARRM